MDTVVFDKTGTLTEGEPRVVAVLPEEGMDADALVEMAAALEQGSEHPVGKAVYEHARLLNLPVRAVADLSVVPGRGIAGTVDGVPYAVGNSGFMQDKGISWKEDESRLREFMRQGASPLYVGRGGCPAGVIMVADSLKPDSRAAVDSLKRMNLRVVMLTGDNAATARHMAGELHIDEVVSDVLPDEKASHVMKMEERGDKVAMVGDGVNDAPALACARVGISMKSGTELAMESSDIVLMKSNPAGVAEAVQLGRTTLLIIRQNLFWAFFYNIIGIPLAAGCLYPAFGLTLNPMIAAGDEFEFPVRRIQFPEAAGVHPTPGEPGEIGRPLPHRRFPFRRAAAGPGPACVRGLRRRPACGPVHPPVLHGSPPAGRRWCGCPRKLSEPGNDGRPGPPPAGSA